MFKKVKRYPGEIFAIFIKTMGTESPGTQGLNPYRLVFGDTYELDIEIRGVNVSTFLKSVLHQKDRVPVARFINLSRYEDPVAGGVPIGLMIQAHPSNGEDVKAPIFKHIEVVEH